VISPDEILTFWIEEVGPAGWYKSDPDLDETIRTRFEATWGQARAGACGLWITAPRSTLAYIILTDQFPRNIFRGDARSFATDRSARAAAKIAMDRGWDMRIPEPERQFFYLPLMHSENQIDQDRTVRLLCERMPETGAANLLHAKAHREVIRRYGRFPYRNAALGRTNTPPEETFLSDGGYGAILHELDDTQPAA